MEINPLPKIGHVLRGLVRDAGYIVLVDEHGGGAFGIERNFLNIDDGAVGDAANGVEPVTTVALHVNGALRFTPQERVAGGGKTHRAKGNCVETYRQTKPGAFRMFSA